MLLSVAALAIDASFMYDRRNQLHAAADAAAKAGAIEIRRDASLTEPILKRFADAAVTDAGFTPAACDAASGVSVCVHHPPQSGPFSCASNPSCQFFVEAIVSQPTGTFFSRVLGITSLTPGARAVAGVSPGPNCMVVFDHVIIKSPASGPSPSQIDMGGCSLVINGQGNPPNDLNNKGDILARTIGVHHTGSAGCINNCTNVTYDVPYATDPLATLPALPAPTTATCTTPYAIPAGASVTILESQINTYYCGLSITSSGGAGTNVTFESGGKFYINGPVTDSGGSNINLTGTGVLIYLGPAGSLQFNSSSNVSWGTAVQPMTAATSGTYNGILFFQDRATPVGTPAIFAKNNALVGAKGAFYFPTAIVSMGNENSLNLMNPCMVVVAWAIEVDKPKFLLNNSCISFAGSPLLTLSLVE